MNFMKTSSNEKKIKNQWFAKLVRMKRVPFIPAVPLAILTILVAAALFAPLIAPYSPLEGNLKDKLVPPRFWEGGKPEYFLGTDFLGRDVLSRLIYGARVSLSVAFLAIFVSGSFGTILGLVSGYAGGSVDNVLMRMTDVGMSMPMLLLAIVLVAVFGASYANIILVVVLVIWPKYARQVRGETLGVKEQEFVALARVSGCSHMRIVCRHILPNVIPTMLVVATLQVGWVIIMESSLSFLGVGIPIPTPAWGVMVAEARGLVASAWWIALFPGAAIMITVASLNLLGDWLRDRLDPKLRSI